MLRRQFAPALALTLILMLATGCSTSRYIQRDAAEIHTRTEATADAPATFSPGTSFGVEGEYKRAWVNALAGPLIPSGEASFGYGVGFWGGYTVTDTGVRYSNDLVLNDFIRTGLVFSLYGADASVWDKETISVELGIKLGYAIIEREQREAIDVIGITREGYRMAAPTLTVRTPLRLKVGELFTAAVVAGGEAAFYSDTVDDFHTWSIKLGLQFLEP